MIVLPLIFALVAGVQQEPVKPRTSSPSVKNDKRPVTCEEGYRVFSEARRIFNVRLKLNLPASSIPQSSKALSKEEVVAEMCAIRKGLESKIYFTLPPRGFSASVLKIGKAQLANLESLIRGGYVGKVSPLATSTEDSMSLLHFGDAVGFFMSRAAEVTHLPSPKWSPNLGAGA